MKYFLLYNWSPLDRCPAGFVGATQGTLRVHSASIDSNMAAVRHNVGVCLQHNVLFEHLTVEEHLVFFAQVTDVIPLCSDNYQ